MPHSCWKNFLQNLEKNGEKALTKVCVYGKINLAAEETSGGHADLAHLVERHLAKVEVASSSLVIRSIFTEINA